jgi:hypothetical protein
MRNFCFLALALFCPTVAQATTSKPGSSPNYFEYLDLLGGEVVGDIDRQVYDRSGHDHFLGPQSVGGTFIGGGFGLRPVWRFNHGVRFSVETSGSWGRLHMRDNAFDFSTMTRAELLTGVGWEGTLGRVLVVHTATVIGLDAAWVSARPRGATLDGTATTTTTMTPALESSDLSRVNLRLGQQLGAHVQLCSVIAFYADGTIDYDGQWRARAGFAFGHPVR